jgi:hypothetical protein
MPSSKKTDRIAFPIAGNEKFPQKRIRPEKQKPHPALRKRPGQYNPKNTKNEEWLGEGEENSLRTVAMIGSGPRR